MFVSLSDVPLYLKDGLLRMELTEFLGSSNISNCGKGFYFSIERFRVILFFIGSLCILF